MIGHRGELGELLQNLAMQRRIDTMIAGDAPLADAAEVFEKILTRKHGKFFFRFDTE